MCGRIGQVRPMLASPTDSVPTGPAWVHEVKWDGMRVLAEAKGGQLRLTSRSGRDVTAAFPELAPLATLYDDMLLDGEVITLEDGVPSFSALAERMHVASARKAATLAGARPVTLMAFDVLRLLGQDLTEQPWTARRALLEQLELDGPRWQVPAVYDDGAGLLAVTAEQGLEGVVSKRREARYTPGRRSPDWRKLAHRPTLSVVVGGWRPETGSATRLGAILAGVPDGDGGWAYVGRVGSGLGGRTGQALRDRLTEAAESPFATDVPVEDARGATWTEPEVVVDVRHLGRGSSGKLRQPSLVAVRTDLRPADLSELGDA
ncbi:bifunctional non-homologous end joining protein LigD [Marihabitans asiaticum]|uniref:DNA ligase (ATP) n=2 Tax=Marihabitans asiaticum TaxID=415218 RepID=A0A560WDB3_9MICO|nr:bifunctional non-homologous end joining protein LigD [Marihabitans asiaticum]